MLFRRLIACLVFLVAFHAVAADLFEQSNLVAWCIVPFDSKKRSPEERAEMVARMGIKKVAYDWRQEHVGEFEREILAYQKHGIEFFAFWSTHDEAFRLFEKYGISPQFWVMLKPAGETDEARVQSAAETLLPVLEKAKRIGSRVGIYNHGGWGGEPEHMVAVCEYLKQHHGTDNVGIVYNLHHGHGHLDRLPRVLELMKPWLLCLNLNGMDPDGESKGRKILPLGAGTEDLKVLRQIRASGYSGPIGILNHTNEDAEGRLLDNLDGLKWLTPQLDDNPPGPKPQYRTWSEAAQSGGQASAAGNGPPPVAVESVSAEFGKALKGGWVTEGGDEYRKTPLTIECRARLDSREKYNILVASDPKASATHWELYTHAKRGTLALYLPGRGGDCDSGVDICDGRWHDLLASFDDQTVTFWIDGKQVSQKPIQPLKGDSKPGGLAFGRLVEGTIGCDGVIDDVRISRGVMKPRKSGAPRLRMDNTLGVWSFDDLATLAATVVAPESASFEPDRAPLNPAINEHWREPVNRERVFDYYGKQALHFMKQHPLPALIPAFPGLDGGRQGHWGNQNDKDTWADGRWAAQDHGSVFSGVFRGAGVTVPKGVCVRHGDLASVFDPETLSFPVTWKGGFIKLNETRHGFMIGAPMDGEVVGKSDRKLSGEYHGFYRYGDEVIFSYSVGGEKKLVTARGEEAGLEEKTHGGPAQWPRWIETRGELGEQHPFATDRITIPFENPYGTLFFLSAHDFFEDGTAAVATMTGEVWLVRGLDETLEKIRWKRFATGLHQPLGLKIVDNQVHVLGRDQITRLHDLNGDDEADFYECVTNAMQTSPGGHDFVVGLEQDAEGRWYFASGNQGVCRITDRNRLDVLATGFRNPNGLGQSPDGKFITTSVQEGDWTPATSLCQIEIGNNEGAHFGAGGPRNGETPEPVLLYLPRGEDNSASSQVFVTGDSWAPLRGDGNLVHLSSGGGSAWLVMRQRVGHRWQAGAVKITGNFDAGPQCARFHPRDGQLYVNGMAGWGSYTPADGAFQRVRFTGGETPTPIGFEARDNGVLVRFDRPVGDLKAEECFAQCWNYRYSAAYGSPEYSLAYPDTPGHDPLEIRGVRSIEDGRAVFVEIPQLIPAGQVHLRLATGHDLFFTLHALGEPFTGFPGYTKIAKTHRSAQIGMTAPKAAKPNPWSAGAAGREIVVEAALGLQYVQKRLTAKAGERLSIRFKNPDVVPHNWMLGKPGTLKTLGDLCNLMIGDPEGLAKHYVPDSKDVLCYTDMVNPKEEFVIHIDAPSEAGEYPYLCSFPGHWMVMNGVLVVQ
ncbi:MAG: heme-binding domain-containing protein [Verrucomicrobiae bacterium]|nr:heme-binding domain-containing protein [Verrucomicrobiae bacterium]